VRTESHRGAISRSKLFSRSQSHIKDASWTDHLVRQFRTPEPFKPVTFYVRQFPKFFRTPVLQKIFSARA